MDFRRFVWLLVLPLYCLYYWLRSYCFAPIQSKMYIRYFCLYFLILCRLLPSAITSNVKSDKKLVVIKCGEQRLETGRKKVGAMLGDHVEVGCGSVLNPGTVIGRDSRVYPLSSVRGAVAPGSIYKKAGEVAAIREDTVSL